MVGGTTDGDRITTVFFAGIGAFLATGLAVLLLVGIATVLKLLLKA